MLRSKISPISILRRLHAPIYGWRVQGILQEIMPHLCSGDRILDVGCGRGIIGHAIMNSPFCPPQLEITGLERERRGRELTPVKYYDGRRIPYADDDFDVVLLVDVLHHEDNPHRLIRECARVAQRVLIIKDHKKDGFFAQQRIALLDWASNMPYGVRCLFRYNTGGDWRSWYERHGLIVEREMNGMKLYPMLLDFFFGGNIQYLAVLRTDGFDR